MKLINAIIKILVNFKYKKEQFMFWSWGIDENHEISIITEEYYQDYYRFGTKEERYD